MLRFTSFCPTLACTIPRMDEHARIPTGLARQHDGGYGIRMNRRIVASAAFTYRLMKDYGLLFTPGMSMRETNGRVSFDSLLLPQARKSLNLG
jgi:hypothetical protein